MFMGTIKKKKIQIYMYLIHIIKIIFFVPYSCILNTHLILKLIFSLYPFENVIIYGTLVFTNNINKNLTFTIHRCIDSIRAILITCF